MKQVKLSQTALKKYATNLVDVTKSNDLVAFVKICAKKYRDGNPLITDRVYDKLWKLARKEEPNDEFFELPEDEFVGKVELPQWMGSQKKAYLPHELERWYKRVKAKNCGKDVDVVVTPKLDGFGVYYSGEQLITRGDGFVGTDITHAIKRGLITEGTGKGEIVMKEDKFYGLLDDLYANPRAAIAAIIKKGELNSRVANFMKSGHVKFIAFDTLVSTRYSFVDLLDNIERIFDKYGTCEYYTDGIVINVCDQDLYEAMGSTKHHPRGAIAYKRNSELIETIIIDIIWQVGREGQISPVLKIKPISFSNKTVPTVNGHSYHTVMSKQLGVGGRVVIADGGKVVAKLHDVITPKTPEYPKRCPSCNQMTMVQGSHLMCTNERCRDRCIAAITHFFKSHNLLGTGVSTVTKLVDGGITVVSQLSDASELSLSLMGISGSKAKTLLENIKKIELSYKSVYTRNGRGNYIGYIWSEHGMPIPKPNRGMFICSNADEWRPNQESGSDQKSKLYRVEFKVKTEKIFYKSDDYQSHIPNSSIRDNDAEYWSGSVANMRHSYDMLSLYRNDRHKPTESILLDPMSSVVAVEYEFETTRYDASNPEETGLK